MKLFKNISIALLIAANTFTVAAMLFCAATEWMPPQRYTGIAYYGLMFPVFVAVNVLFAIFWLIFKRRFAFIPLIGMALCACAIRTYIPFNLTFDPPEGSIKILSYNTHSFGGHNDEPWEENAVIKYLSQCQADIICLQEATRSDLDEAFAPLADIYPYISVAKKEENYIACLSKFPIDSVRQIEYGTTTNFSFAYNINVNGQQLLLINNHLESYRLEPIDKENYKSILVNYKRPKQNATKTKLADLTEKLSYHDSIRGVQTDSVAAFVERRKGCYIVACGDFNSSPISYTHHRLTRQLNDAYTRSGNGPGISYHQSGMYFRLDNILVSPNITPYAAKVDNSIQSSDHYPIECYIVLE